MEIKLNDPDDPAFGHEYHPDRQSNKFIQFQHTSIKKDAGYHTVPFFDGQSVETRMKFPLGGIGLFHRGRDGFGGYIAPRLITYNITRIIESSFNDWKQLENLYKHCGLEVPAHATVLKKNVDCKTLKENASRQVHVQNKSQITRNNTINSQPDPQVSYEQMKKLKQIMKKKINQNSKDTTIKKKSSCLPKNRINRSPVSV
ncbi:hypothetical protein PV326_008941, partial [Microctonus aethiopoides]